MPRVVGTSCVEQELGAAAELLAREVCFFFARFTLSTASSPARIMRLIQYSPVAFTFLFAEQVLACMDLRPTTNTGWRAARTSCRRGSTCEGSMLACTGRGGMGPATLLHKGVKRIRTMVSHELGGLWDFLSPPYKDSWLSAAHLNWEYWLCFRSTRLAHILAPRGDFANFRGLGNWPARICRWILGWSDPPLDFTPI